MGAWQRAKILAFTPRVRLPCWRAMFACSLQLTSKLVISACRNRFFIKTPTQNLNLQHFAKTLEALCADSFCALMGSKGPPLARFLGSFFAVRQRMNIQKAAQRGAKLYARPKEKSLELSIVLIFQHLVRKIFTIIPPKTLDFSPILLYNELSNE